MALSVAEPQGTSPYAVDYVFDGTLTVGSLSMVYLMHEIAGKSLDNDYICSEAHPDVPCTRANLPSIDKSEIGKHSKTWDKVGNYGFYTIIGGAVLGRRARQWPLER